MAISNGSLTAKELWPYLERCGYGLESVLRDVRLPGNRTATFAGFAQRPFDTRSACFSALDAVTIPEQDASACRDLGAPVTFLCHRNHLLWFSQTPDQGACQIGVPIPRAHLDTFFQAHTDDFAPKTIYRAKTLGRFERAFQRDFVDLGLMPLVEKEAGQTIERLLLDSVAEARDALGWPKDVNLNQGRWLVKSVFWLLGAKMLHDKGVEGFIRLNFDNLDEVFSRVAAHYGESAEGIVTSQPKRRALETVTKRVASSADLRLGTTEALAYVYENTLISDEVRAEFGTHSTPSYLVDYIVGRLEPWIREIAQNRRSVFEPATGHGAFLIAAIRLLTSLLPAPMAEPPARKKYLRDRVRGYDVDDFAIEIARLSLTLTDIPNPNGWSVRAADLFESDLIEKASEGATILLANPPFEDFKAPQRTTYARKFREPRFLNKAAEMLYRALAVMPADSVFGVVVPQSLLHEANAVDLRKLFLEQFEFQELCLFPDKVFNFADQESAVLIGRKHPPASPSTVKVRYRRVRERQMELFANSYRVTSEVTVNQDRFQQAERFDLRVPDLESVWQHCRNLSKLDSLIHVGQGFSHMGEDQPRFPAGVKTVSDEWFEGGVEGYENLGSGVHTHQLPKPRWLNLSNEVVGRERSGTATGIAQVLLNEAPVQRAPWCLKAMIDREGKPAKSRFTLLRPDAGVVSLTALWALMNSPLANAWAYAHSTKRNILTGTVRQLPVPEFGRGNLDEVERAAQNYLKAVGEYEQPFPLRSDDARQQELQNLRTLHWRMDAAILRLYALPVELERELLNFFAGSDRAGVPFKQERYFPQGFDEAISLTDFLAITADWDATNKRRHELIEKKAGRALSPEEATELKQLQRMAGLKRELLASPSLNELREVEADLRRRGLWQGA
jgi:type I restriction-modification system DNA methylase subunit